TTEQDPSLETTPEKASYGMGLVMGERMSNDLPDLQMQQFIQGFEHGQAGDEEAKRLSREEIQTAHLAYQKSLRLSKSNRTKDLPRKIRRLAMPSWRKTRSGMALKPQSPAFSMRLLKKVAVKNQAPQTVFRFTTRAS